MRFVCDSLKDIYAQVGPQLLQLQNEVSPRGNKTKEIIGAQIVLTNPRARLFYKEGRNFSLIYALVESIMLFNPSNALKNFSYFNKTMKLFSDDGETLYGNYGSRIAFKIEQIVEKLKKDPSSRQAVLTIYNSSDLMVETKDVPCTLSLQFMIRNNKLNCITNMRSNDIIWGLPYDVFAFTMLQEAIANTLGIDVGEYIHNVGSLHVYEKHYDLLNSLTTGGESIEFEMDCTVRDMYLLSNEYTYIVNDIVEHYYDKQGSFGEILLLLRLEDNYKWSRELDIESLFKPTLTDIETIPYWSRLFSMRYLKC